MKSKWKPGDDFCVRFADKVCESRTEVEFSKMLLEMKKVANDYGFDISGSGSWQSMKVVAFGEEEIMKKYRDKLEDDWM